jgi:UDPglucose--hexose-1-phosphate uridylyltransferase
MNYCLSDFEQDDPLFKLKAEQGESRIICFSPVHGRSIAELSLTEVTDIVRTWQQQNEE